MNEEETVVVEWIVSPERYQAVLDSGRGLMANDGTIHNVASCRHLLRYPPEQCVNNGYDKLYTPLMAPRVLESVLDALGLAHRIGACCRNTIGYDM